MTYDPKYASHEEKQAFAAGLAKAAAEFADPPLTLADVRGMTVDEIKRRKPEVDEVLRRGVPGKVEDEDGDDDDE